MFLSFENVTKLYGPVIGINSINCRIGPGITGLFGANGAGKSTMMKLASGQLRPTQGKVHIDDEPAWSNAAKRLIGFSPDINSFYEEMTGRRFVYTMARMYGFSMLEARDRTHRVLVEVGMESRADVRIAGMSHGMRQRIKLAQALVHEPQVLLLDEPMAGIDPGGRRDISHLLLKYAVEGKTILFSSHILVELQELAEEILMIARGRIVASGTLADVRNLIDDQPFTVELVCEESRRLAALLIGLEVVDSVGLRGDILTVRTRNPNEFFSQVSDLVIKNTLELHKMQLLDTGADAVFGYLEGGTT